MRPSAVKGGRYSYCLNRLTHEYTYSNKALDKLRITPIGSTRTFNDKVDSQEGNSPELFIRPLIAWT